MNKPFSKNYEVHYYEINKHLEAAPLSLVNFLEDAAIWHSQSVGLGLDRLKEDGLGWILNGWFLEFQRPAHLFENLIVETWPSSFERFYATREFLVKNTAGELLVRASSLWILVNIEKGRPVRIPERFGEAYGLNSARAVDHSFDKMDIHTDFEIEKQFYIRKSDIDTNEHVNNKKYLDWMLEAIPEAVYDNFSLSSLEISYIKGAYYGSTILSRCKTLEEELSLHKYLHTIQNNASDLIHATGRTEWISRAQAAGGLQ